MIFIGDHSSKVGSIATILNRKDQWIGTAYKENGIYCLQAKVVFQKAVQKHAFAAIKLLSLQL
jgi:hypothetical protein